MLCDKPPFHSIALPSRNPRSGDELSRTSVLIARTHSRTSAALSCLTLLLACAHPEPLTAQSDNSGGAASNEVSEAGAGAKQGTPHDWCAARTVLRAKCQRCHQDPTQHGAPFPLLTYADTQVVDRQDVPRFQRMKTALETDYMPPSFLELEPAVELLSDSERSTLLGWLSSEPPLDASCD